jgi:hypothetical protein
VHSVCTTAASVADCHMLPELLHTARNATDGATAATKARTAATKARTGYQGQTGAIQQAAPKAQDITCKRTKFKTVCGRVTEKEEPEQVQSKSEGGTCVPHPEAHLRLRQGALPGDREEPPPAVRLLRSDQSLSPPQTPSRTCAELRLKSPKQPGGTLQTATPKPGRDLPTQIVPTTPRQI